MSGFTFGAFCVVLAILMAITVGSEIFIEEDVHPHTKFVGLLLASLLAGLLGSVVIEKLNIKLLV